MAVAADPSDGRYSGAARRADGRAGFRRSVLLRRRRTDRAACRAQRRFFVSPAHRLSRSPRRACAGASRIARCCRCMGAPSNASRRICSRGGDCWFSPGTGRRPAASPRISRNWALAIRICMCSKISADRASLFARRAPADFALADIGPLNTLAVELKASPGARVIPLTPGLPDDWFEHDGQITKRDIRAVTLAALAPRKGELLWDIGAGSGSIGIEWMLADPANHAIAIECDAARAARIARNAATPRRSRTRHYRRARARRARWPGDARRDLHRRRRRCAPARRRVGRASSIRPTRRQRRDAANAIAACPSVSRRAAAS